MELNPGKVILSQLREIYFSHTPVVFSKTKRKVFEKAYQTLQNTLSEDKIVYGVTTGFGALAERKIEKKQLSELQHSLIESHATGVGNPIPVEIVRLILILKLNCLHQGYSGVSDGLVQALNALYQHQLYPVIPEKGSVGASGDLAPLAHLARVLLGTGYVFSDDKQLDALQALSKMNLKPLTLGPKEGLALINGTQVSTAYALAGLFRAEHCLNAAMIAGCLSTIAVNGRTEPFDARIQHVRLHAGQQKVAAFIRECLKNYVPIKNQMRVQDPYSIRCQPQVIGACLTQMEYVASVIANEANAVTDNPLVFGDDHEVLSGGNFHAEAVALAADALASAMSEIGALSERRIALLMDAKLSGLPPFLIKNSGRYSGLMNLQVTAAALASENKWFTHPVATDSIPTSANQEDHVSMATHAARRLLELSDNLAAIIAIELISACQGIDLRALSVLPAPMQSAYDMVRSKVAYCDVDRCLLDKITTVAELIQAGVFSLNSAVKTYCEGFNCRI